MIIPSPERTNLRLITVYLSEKTLKKIEQMVEKGLHINRSDFLRTAVRSYILKHLEIADFRGPSENGAVNSENCRITTTNIPVIYLNKIHEIQENRSDFFRKAVEFQLQIDKFLLERLEKAEPVRFKKSKSPKIDMRKIRAGW